MAKLISSDPEYTPLSHAPNCVNNPDRPKEPAMMGRRIWKYSVSLGQRARIPVGASAKVIFVALQEHMLNLWFEMRDDDPCVNPRVFYVAATGEDLLPNAEHVGSVITQGGLYVWHVYELPQ